uniref:Small ribosomal subunit protein uS19c n=1 Tax=Prototheca zopfii TaxID=3112 RepID=A0A2P1G7K2_9CHLO|nr:ribosomal protein S19 [Prototheca bovis]AVM80928.1 ribosomal protein S19 [Prototheca bovis]
MSRSSWKGPFCELKITDQNQITHKTWSRRSLILPNLLGKTLFIHNGKSFIPCKIKEEMIGFKLGEFASTRKLAIHKKKKSK